MLKEFVVLKIIGYICAKMAEVKNFGARMERERKGVRDCMKMIRGERWVREGRGFYFW